MQEQVIQITGLHKSFGQIEAVRDLSIEVRRGQLFAFLGVNGAGKSTTIAMLCGQLTPDSGEVLVCGQNMRREPRAAMRKLGVVFQGSVLDRALSVRENLASRAALYGLSLIHISWPSAWRCWRPWHCPRWLCRRMIGRCRSWSRPVRRGYSRHRWRART